MCVCLCVSFRVYPSRPSFINPPWIPPVPRETYGVLEVRLGANPLVFPPPRAGCGSRHGCFVISPLNKTRDITLANILSFLLLSFQT